jgi:O-antigen ligase
VSVSVAPSGETLRRPRTARFALGSLDAPAIGAWVLGFALVAYLALDGGGYDPVLRGQVGIAAWWLVLLGVAVGVFPGARLRPAAWAGLAAVTALAAWTLVSSGWSESQERTVADLGKVAAYGGFFTLALCVVGRPAARHAVDGVAAAIGLVAVVAVLSRLEPSWLGNDELGAAFGENAQRKLAYPLNYWNALAVFVGMGLGPMLRAATQARTIVVQALAAALVPVMVLCVYLTVSRGGVGVVLAAVLAWIVLTPDRLPKLGTLLIAGAGAALLVAGADQRDALQAGIDTAALRAEGDSLLWMAVVVCAGVALLNAALGLAVRHARRPRWTVLPRRRAPWVAAALVVALAGGAVAAGVPGTVEREWNDFKSLNAAPETNAGEDAFGRLGSGSVSGNGRYQYWEQAVEAQQTRPLGGIGSGTFEFWWARNASYGGGFVRDAHSLYLETFGELGLVGLLLVGGLLLGALGVAIERIARRRSDEHRGAIAAAAAGCVAFAVGAAAEWVWELGAIAAALMVLIAVVLQGARGDLRASRTLAGRLAPRVVLGVVAVAGLVAVAVPLTGAASLRASQAEAADARLGAALEDARTAAAVQPYAAAPRLQQALVLEAAGDLDAAAAQAKLATGHEPTNWRVWLVRARIDAQRGEPQAALRAFRKARRLNPRSPVFQR